MGDTIQDATDNTNRKTYRKTSLIGGFCLIMFIVGLIFAIGTANGSFSPFGGEGVGLVDGGKVLFGLSLVATIGGSVGFGSALYYNIRTYRGLGQPSEPTRPVLRNGNLPAITLSDTRRRLYQDSPMMLRLQTEIHAAREKYLKRTE